MFTTLTLTPKSYNILADLLPFVKRGLGDTGMGEQGYYPGIPTYKVPFHSIHLYESHNYILTTKC